MASPGLIHTISSSSFKEIFDKSSSIAHALREMGYTEVTSAYKAFRRRCEVEGLDHQILVDRSREVRRTILAESNGRAMRPLAEVMVEDSDYNRGNLKRRLIKEGMLLPVCSKCGVGEEWLGEPLTLILDHINGVNRDHRRENLRLLCPNCNSQTTTFSGRNMQNRRKRRLCSECGSAVSKGAFVCQKCHLSRLHETNAASYKVVPGERPSLDDIRKMKKTMSWGEIGKMYGVSDTAVKKWVRVAGGDVKEFGDRRHRRRLSEVA